MASLIKGLDEGGWTGFAVSGAGDVDGDGFPDAVVAALFSDAGAPSAGAVCLLLGRPDFTATDLSEADAVYLGAHSESAGDAVAGGGDVDGDGLADLLIGAPRHYVVGEGSVGAAYLVLGSATPTHRDLASADVTFLGEASGDAAGSAVAGVGDVDGDGFGDPATAVLVCGPASWGYVRDATDCDDAGPWAARTYPGAARWESATACMQDADGDGWGDPAPACPAAAPGTDCDDVSEKAPYTFPGSAAYDAPDECTLDQDGDGYGADRPAMPGVEPGRDCCDACPYNWQTYPGAAPLDSESACMRDHDGDGWGDASPGQGRLATGSDCDDGDGGVHPGAMEVCDEVDQDCDGVVDDGVSITLHPDADGDGFGDATTSV